VAATIRLGREAPVEERAALATNPLESGEVTCECHLPPPGTRPLMWRSNAPG